MRAVSAGQACYVNRIRWAFLRVECPFDAILDKTMPEHCAGVVENDCVEFARSRPKDSTDHLSVEPHLFRRSGENYARDIWQVPAFGKDHAICYELGLARSQPC